MQDLDDYDDEDPAFIHVSILSEGRKGWKAGITVLIAVVPPGSGNQQIVTYIYRIC